MSRKLGSRPKIKLWNIKAKLPKDGITVFLICEYENKNQVRAVGWYNEDEKNWSIEWSDDHPQSEDVKYWIEEV